MNLQLITAISVVTLTALTACNNARAPDQVANDVASAQEAAAQKVAAPYRRPSECQWPIASSKYG